VRQARLSAVDTRQGRGASLAGDPIFLRQSARPLPNRLDTGSQALGGIVQAIASPGRLHWRV
jgi:hypothetical protein